MSMREMWVVTGDESLEQLKVARTRYRRLSLGAPALIRFVDRFTRGALTVTEVQELGDLLESDSVDYLDTNSEGVIAQVLFEMSTPEVNGEIDEQAAERWRRMLSLTRSP